MSDGKQPKHVTDNKNHILNCAIRLINQSGYDNVSITQICKEAGISKSTFHYYYPLKKDLLSSFDNYFNDFVEKSYLRILEQDTSIKQIWTIFQILFEQDLKHGPKIVQQVYIQNLLENDQRDYPKGMGIWDTLVSLVAKSQAAKEMQNSMPPEDIAYALCFGTRAGILTWAIENGESDLFEINRKIVNTILIPSEGHEL